MNKKLTLILTVFLLLGGLVGSALADSAITSLSSFFNFPRMKEYTIGWRFTVDSEITLTHIGFYDWEFSFSAGDGIQSDHEVGLWAVSDPTTNLVAGAVITAGPTDADGYRYVEINPPVVLDPLDKYYIGIFCDDENQDYIMAADYVFNPLVNLDPHPSDPIKYKGFVHKAGSTITIPTDNVITGWYVCVNFLFTQSILVEIDIKPNCYPNWVILRSWGVLPVAIFSSETFNATTIDPATVNLSGAGVAVWGQCQQYLAVDYDINDDGLDDLFVLMEIENLNPDQIQEGFGVLTGYTYDGLPIAGYDELMLFPSLRAFIYWLLGLL